ncbi:MAG: hypothetical protein CFH34_01452 [Alphaproteobacteria bacterium MarineAlpha9_Bin4]|nr:MAG: hypothetical protein CFH34_01452 [Alphaproteobacteria bacterium MarineAlpha9_Bin4]
MDKIKRKLSTILAADCVGFSSYMDKNEELTLASLKSCRAIIDKIIDKYGGRIFYTAGDSVIAEFSSPVNSIKAAIEFQKLILQRNRSLKNNFKLMWRVGLHLDDVIIEGDNIFGTGVNIAARLEACCTPGQILISTMVKEQVFNKIEEIIVDAGTKILKNISDSYQTFGIAPSGDKVIKTDALKNTANQKKAKAYKPKLAVMPFSNINNDNEGGYLVDGIVEDLITEFSMIKELDIISRQSCFDFKDSKTDINDFKKRFSLDYLVTGNIRSSGKRVRVSVELSEAKNSSILWNNKYDRVLKDIFEVQDEIVRKISLALLGEIEISSLERAKRKPTESLTSYELLLKGKVLHHKFEKEALIEAIETFDKAIEADKNNGQAYAWKACAIGQGLGRGYLKGDFNKIWSQAEICLKKARELDDNDFEVHRLLAEIKLSQKDFKLAEKHARKCYKLVPNDPRVLSVYGEILIRTGQSDKGIEALERAYELDPIAPGKENEDHRVSSLLLGYFLVRNKKSCLELISKLENIDKRSWLLTAKLCHDEEYNYYNEHWYLYGKKKFFNADWNTEIKGFKLNNDSTSSSLTKFVNNLFEEN